MFKLNESSIHKMGASLLDFENKSFGENKLFFNLNKEILLHQMDKDVVNNWWICMFERALKDRDYQWFIDQGVEYIDPVKLSDTSHKILYMYLYPERAKKVWEMVLDDMGVISERKKKEIVCLIKNLYADEQYKPLLNELEKLKLEVSYYSLP